ncbi:hypothetical protein OG21DRAFT_1484641 [Imleria badia]|nr:hypothetical protein OG21DRAFT_1484641 [Imleria badia]
MFPLLKVLSLPAQRCFIKYGPRVRLTEAATNEFIAKHTSIPVPRILDVFKYDGTVHIVQEFIDAPLLLKVWRKLELDDRKRCMIQLKGYIEQLRSLVPPKPGKVQSIDGEGFTDGRLGYDEWGPFESHDAFNNFFHHEKVRKLPGRYPRAQAPLAAEIAAIIDWEFSGWFPEYWEYTRVYFGLATFRKDYGWWEIFQEYTECYSEELEFVTWSLTGDHSRVHIFDYRFLTYGNGCCATRATRDAQRGSQCIGKSKAICVVKRCLVVVSLMQIGPWLMPSQPSARETLGPLHAQVWKVIPWAGLGLGLSFIRFNAFFSSALHLGVGSSLLTSTFRYIAKFAIMRLVLHKVFETNNPWAIGGIAFANKSKKRYGNMVHMYAMSVTPG